MSARKKKTNVNNHVLKYASLNELPANEKQCVSLQKFKPADRGWSTGQDDETQADWMSGQLCRKNAGNWRGREHPGRLLKDVNAWPAEECWRVNFKCMQTAKGRQCMEDHQNGTVENVHVWTAQVHQCVDSRTSMYVEGWRTLICGCPRNIDVLKNIGVWTEEQCQCVDSWRMLV